MDTEAGVDVDQGVHQCGDELEVGIGCVGVEVADLVLQVREGALGLLKDTVAFRVRGLQTGRRWLEEKGSGRSAEDQRMRWIMRCAGD